MADFKEWEGFEGTIWKDEVNTRDFIQKNYVPYDGDESFLADPTDATDKLWGELQKLQKEERAKGGVLDSRFAPAVCHCLLWTAGWRTQMPSRIRRPPLRIPES